MKPVIDHLNLRFSEVLSNDSEQRIDEHIEFKGRSRMKQYIKSKPIKWGFKFWFHCSSKSGCLYQMDIYLGRKQIPVFNLGLGGEVVLQLTKDLEQSFCTVYFDNLFNSPKLIETLFRKGIYVIGRVWANRKQMPKMIDDKQMKVEIASSLFQVLQWLPNRWIIGQCFLYYLPLKEWITYYQFREKRV